MKVLFATAELAPLARVGGLAEAASGLVRALRAEHPDIGVHVVLPDYGGVVLDDERQEALDVPAWVGGATVRHGHHRDAGAISLVTVPGMARPHPYVDGDGEGWPDNDHRFFGFSAAVAAMAQRYRPDVVHLNDWHTAATVGLLAQRPPTVLTIHTLGYQGVAGGEWLSRLSVEPGAFEWYGGTNPLAGAIGIVDRVIAVSPNYASEILTPESGMGLHERLAAVGDRLVGIRNGIDVGVWNPATDEHLTDNFDADDLDGRRRCRVTLRNQAGWPDDTEPVIAAVTRLVEQKGIDLLADTARFLAHLPARLAVLGSGSADLAGRLRAVADAHPDRVWFVDGYDAKLAHRMFAGSDLYVMPSRFEPCGLGQMQAMAYGSVPVVTDVGGLHDTVIDADADRSAGTGFVSQTVDAAGLVDAYHRACRALRHKGRRESIQRRGMTTDWSWTEPAARHVDIYREVAGRG